MASYYNPSKRLSEWAAALLSPYIKLENEGAEHNNHDPQTENNAQGGQQSPSSLSVGLWSGNVELKNVELRPEAFEKWLNKCEDSKCDGGVQIKWKLIRGSIDSLKIQIPWKSLLVGSAYSSSKHPTSNDDGGEATEKKGPDDREDDSACAGCTTVHINGVKLLLGYDIIHHHPFLNALQRQKRQDGSKTLSGESAQPAGNELQKRIREEKKRVLQVAERRLLAGLDPFPPTVMEGLQSLMAASIQSGIQSAVDATIPLKPTAVPSDDASIGTSNTTDTQSKHGTYISRVENYLSSTIKTLIWRVFDSLSLSMAQVQLSVVGQSHYDKDFASRFRRAHNTKGGRAAWDVNSPEKLQQHQRMRKKRHGLNRDHRLHRRPPVREVGDITESRPSHRRTWPAVGRESTGSMAGEESGEVTEENPLVWAREGQIEVGITLDRFNVRPGHLPLPPSIDAGDSAGGVQAEPVALKLMRCQGVGLFIRRKHLPLSRGDGAWEYANSEGIHTGRTLTWNGQNGEDYILGPTNIEASCKLSRSGSNSSSVQSVSSSPQKKEGESLVASATVLASGSKGTATTKRRGKREKRQKVSEEAPHPIASPLPKSELSPLGPEAKGPASQSTGTAPTSATTGRSTHGTRHQNQSSSGGDSFLPPHRLELSVKMGHLRSSITPRQLFLLHSLSSSMTRMKRGRPLTSIRTAQANDEALRKQMAEDGQSLLAWEDHIYREVPSLRPRCSRKSVRSLPLVVSSWWRYALFNVVNEMQSQKNLLSQCCGDSASNIQRKNRGILSLSINPRIWDRAYQSRVRREYIDLYLQVHKSPQGQTSGEPADEVAAAAAALRLGQLEEELSVERILLLKSVARAASIHRARIDEDEVEQVQEQPSSSAETYYSFPLHSRGKVDGAWNEHRHGSSRTLQSTVSSPHEIEDDLLYRQEFVAPSYEINTYKNPDGAGRTIQASTLTGGISRSLAHEKESSLSFSVNLFLSGFSLAVCEFRGGNVNEVDPEHGDMDQFYQPCPSDDISALTGYSGDDDSKTLQQTGTDVFDPSCQFWLATWHGLKCEAILVMHMADIFLSAHSVKMDIRPPPVESKLLVGGIALQGGTGQMRQCLLCLGNIQADDMAETTASAPLSAPLQTLPNKATGLSGQYTGLDHTLVISVCPVEVLVDWDWLETMTKFASANTDIGPKRVTAPLQAEALLVKASNQKRFSENALRTSLELDNVSLTIPVYRATAKAEEETTSFVASTNRLCVKSGVNLYASSSEESRENAPVVDNDPQPGTMIPSQDVLIVLDSFDVVLATSKGAPTRLLRSPISVQMQYSVGDGASYSASSPSIGILVSEFRLRTLMDMMETISGVMSKSCDCKEKDQPLRPSLPALKDYVLAETKLSIQSFCLQIVSDDDEIDCPVASSPREQLHDVIASFISQLSCLDLRHPNKEAVACMERLMMDRCCALGFSEGDARKCMETARANFDREVSANVVTSSIQDAEKARRLRRRTTKRKTARKTVRKTVGLTTLHSMNPESLSLLLDEMAGRATANTVATFEEVLLMQDSSYSEHQLSIDFSALEASMSLFYTGKLVQVSAASFAIGTREAILLKMQRQGSDVQSSQHRLEEKNSSDDSALTFSSRDSGADIDAGCYRDIYFEAGCVTSIFAPEPYLQCIQACNVLAAGSKTDGHKVQHNLPKKPARQVVVNGNISCVSAILTDKFIPFVKIQLNDVALERKAATTSLRAGILSVDCLYQSAYPSIISSYPSQDGDGFGGHSAFSIEMISHPDPTCPNDVYISLDGVRITILRQILNEFLQYTSSSNYGIGLFTSGMESEKGADESLATSTPPKLTVTIGNSSVVLPRDSKSVDMVGLEVDSMVISREQVAESWSLDNHSFSDDEGKRKQSASSSSSDMFFDCMDGDQTRAYSAGSSLRHLQHTLRRFAVQMKGAHIFTALNNHRHSTDEVNMPEFNENVQHTGRVEHNKLPFSVRGKINTSTAEDINARAWEEITGNPLNLGIKVDYAPTLRVLVEDTCGDDPRGVSFDMRMSQYYLLMSIWFSNMQELPIMFPYERDFVEKCSTNPDPPLDWPEYGTNEFVKRLKCGGSAQETFEMALCFKNLRWRCSYDRRNYFASVPPSMHMMQSMGRGLVGKSRDDNFVLVELSLVMCSVIMDDDTLQRIGLGAASIALKDGRQGDTSLPQGISAKGDPSGHASFVDLHWGLDCGRHTLIDGLPQPFQLTVFLTPDQHCLINLGLEMADAALVDLSLIWILLDFFGLYFKDSHFGHPGFEAERLFHTNTGDAALEAANKGEEECLSIDFRMWMIDPHVMIPSSSQVPDDICVMLEAAGLYYRYKSFGSDYSSQEVVAKDLGIVVLREYMEPSISRGLRQVSGALSSCGVKTLVDGLSFSLRYNYNLSTKYTRFALQVPLTSKHFDRHSMDGIECSNIEAQPFSVPPPSVCQPFVSPSRTMGHHETRIYFSSQEYVKTALDRITTFAGPTDPETAVAKDAPAMDDNGSETENLFSATAHVERVKLVISDPQMGMHRPILSVCLPSLLLSGSQLREAEPSIRTKIRGTLTKIDNLTGRGAFHEAADLQASMEATIFVDYFKLGLTRNWEPCVEPFKFLVLYEKSSSRGKGITVNADCPLHFNITGALIETIDDAIKSFDLFQSGSPTSATTQAPSQPRRLSSEPGIVKTISADEWGRHLTVLHRTAERLEGNERTAFSLKNNSGERVRVHTHSAVETDLSSSQTTISYLDHLHLMALSFPATETIINNLQSVEVPFKGDQNISSASNEKQSASSITSHDLDVQLPGFQWVRDISFDRAGKHFVELIPRALSIQAKVNEDWRLKNALHILTEVNSVNGGRRLTIKSTFEVVNKTDHPLHLAISPDPRHSPAHPICNNLDAIQESDEESRAGSTDNSGFTIDTIDPEEVYCLSPLLLESALRIKGNHLGSLWIRPNQATSDRAQSISEGLSSSGLGQSTVGYPSRPIQLAKILHESSVIFKESNGDPSISNRIASGVEVSCPIFDSRKSRSSRPFCYVMEVKRSPIVKSTQVVDTMRPEPASTGEAMSPTRMGKGLRNAKNIFTKAVPQEKAETHAPIAYSLVIHPPITIENLLPERGRFELMDATSRNVLWWGHLEAGEKVPVHSVGLDAPLLLLVNLGFCRTAVGEGALVHHGGGEDGLFKAGWNATIGSAMKTSKYRVKKTLTTMTESKDDRGAKRVSMLQAGNMTKGPAGNRKTGQLGFNTENEMIESAVGGVLRRGDAFSAEDIATELSVIDSLGQRLQLHIDNAIGNGGQRRISLYCPFWIVNTTEHSLRYKQEKALSYVSGTVLSPEKDGSKAVDGSYRNDLDEEDECLISGAKIGGIDTVFSGRPGALSLLNDLEDDSMKPALLAALISEELPLRVLSKLAFMFNFQDVLSIGASSRLCIQLADTSTDSPRYTSAWSSGFGLESVGVTQIVAMHCKEGRGLEVSVSISVAPGRLSNYTKIVRICPRYIVVNQLPRSIRLWQDNSILHPNLAIEHSHQDVVESRKWMFTRGQPAAGVINQYELLFGSPTMIDCDEENGINAQTTAHRDACYIASVRPSQVVAFHLPDTRLERLLRVDFGPTWYLSPSFAADITGEYVLPISRAKDLRMLPHVSSRGAPVYTVTLPPTGTNNGQSWNGDLGIWFETDWGRDRTLVVKGIREGSFASYYTDVIVGDELIMIDAIPVEQLTFDEAMKYLKARLVAAKESAEARATQSSLRPLQIIGRNKTKKRLQRAISNDDSTLLSGDNAVTLTFLTLEERLRRLRRAAVSKDGASNVLETKSMLKEFDHAITNEEGSKELLVDMKFLFQSVFVFLRQPDPKDPPHRIINRSLHWVIYFRQKGCDAHPWKSLSPGESASYTWEEIMKAKKLSVRVGVGERIESELGRQSSVPRMASEGASKKRRPLFTFQFIEDEEQGTFGPTKTVRLEEIGYMDSLPCPIRGGQGKERSLHCRVDTEGSTRVLIISDEVTGSLDNNEQLVRYNLANIRKQISDEEERRARIDALNKAFVSLSGNSGLPASPRHGPGVDLDIEDSLTSLSPIDERTSNPSRSEPGLLLDAEAIDSQLQEIADYDEGHFITKRHQVIVEVLEATGLRSSDLNGLSNPYVKVGLIHSNKKRRAGSFRRKETRSTYYVEKTLSPQWSHQSFVFDVPDKAASDPRETRRLSVQCVIRSIEKLGKDKFLGQAHVHLRNLRDQREHVGWYPLMGKLGQSDTGKDPLDRICGSIRLRVQWVYDYSALTEYYLLCTDRRLETLRGSKEGMKRQLKSLLDEAKKEKEQRDYSIAKPALAAFYKRRHKSFGPELDGKEDKSSQPLKVIKGTVKLKKTAARFIAASKMTRRESKRGSVEKRSMPTESFHSLDIDENSSSDDDMSTDFSCSEEFLLDGSDNGSNRSPGLGKSSAETASPDRSPNPGRDAAFVLDSHSCSYAVDTRLLCLRWQNWEYHNNNIVEERAPAFYRSWNISRVFVNGSSADKERQKDHSHIDPGVDHLDLGGNSLAELLKLPPAAPHLIVERESKHARELMRSRASFSKAARRSLGSVLNPGGVLTIRPITALNLPETFTGMFVKLRYGTRICLSETVDSKVAPVWTSEESIYSEHAIHRSASMKISRRTLITPRRNSACSDNDAINDFNDIAQMVNPATAWGQPRENDLTIPVGAFETGRSVRLTVIGERLQSKVECGVLEIPLGPALECCAQSMEDYEEDRNRMHPAGLPPAYVRWFPLMSPSEAIPIEGDMGKTLRPNESEKVTDDLFETYFAPCIKLALMFRPNKIDSDFDEADASKRSNTDQYIYARMNRLSAALIDSSRIMELLSFTSRDADLRISVTTAKTRLSVAVGNVQVDQQSSGVNTVILAPTPVKHPQPTVQFLAWKDNIRSKSDIDSYEYVAMQVEELDLKIEESWLFDVWELYLDVAKKRDERANIWKQDNKTNLASARFEAEQVDTAYAKARSFLEEVEKTKRKKIYVRELLLGFMKINLSYFKSSKRDSDNTPFELEVHPSPYSLPNAGQQSADVYRQWSENVQGGSGERSEHANINIISAVIPSISEAPIRFQERQILHVYESEGDIWTSLKSFYTGEALSQLYKIAGSLDFVGNPTMVLTSFRTGLRDFFLQPSRELKHITKNPSRVGVGVLKGTLSLLSNTTSSIFGFASNLGATVGHTATMLTLDEDFQRLHSEQKAAQQRHYDRWKKKGFGHVTLMVSRPVHDIVFGVLSASTGLVTEPYRGAKRDGAVGFTKGTAIGLIGVVVKPIVGVSDAFSHVMESVHDIAKSVNLLEGKFKPPERYRLPYNFGSRRMLLPYRQVDSRSAQMLLAHPLDKKYRKGEEVIVSCEELNVGIGIDDYVVVTTMRVALFRLKIVDGHGFVTVALVWQVRFEKGVRIAASLGNRGHNGCVLYVSRYSAQKGRRLDEADDCDNSVHSSTLDAARELKSDQDRRGDFYFVEGEGRYSNPDAPKSFYPLGPTTAAFRLRTTWPFTGQEDEKVTRFAVEGNFQQRIQLSRIHNAICCLTGDFDSIIYEGSRYDSEGTTSFGPLIFERPEQNGNVKAPDQDLGSIYSSLERCSWRPDGGVQDESPLFADSPRNAGLSSSLSWLAESRARGMSLTPMTPASPTTTDPSRDGDVSEAVSELEDGLQTPEAAAKNISHVHNINLQSTTQALAEGEDHHSFQSHPEDHSISSPLGSSDYSNYFDDITANGDFDMTVPPIEDEVLQQKLPVIEESLPADPSLISTPTPLLPGGPAPEQQEVPEVPDLDGRLRRVEAMLESLVGGDSSMANLSHAGRSILSPTTLSQHDHDHLSAASSTFIPFNSPTPSVPSQSDNVQVEALLKEVDELKQQLAARNSSWGMSNESIPDVNNSEVPSLGDDGPSESKPRGKLRSGVKKLFRGVKSK